MATVQPMLLATPKIVLLMSKIKTIQPAADSINVFAVLKLHLKTIFQKILTIIFSEKHFPHPKMEVKENHGYIAKALTIMNQIKKLERIILTGVITLVGISQVPLALMLALIIFVTVILKLKLQQ